MKKITALVFLFFGFAIPVFASSQQAYKDYLYQFDVYRQKYSEFTVAKNEYLKFKTLTSQATALEKTKAMLTQRDLTLRAYLFLLKEKLNEVAVMSEVEKNTSLTVINNEVTFLDGHSKLVNEIGSLEDATGVSQELQTHYSVLQASMRQTITGIMIGNLTKYRDAFDKTLADAKSVIGTNRGVFSLNKQSTIDRWILQITNDRSLYQQKIDAIIAENNQLRGSDVQAQDQTFTHIQKEVAEAKQYLVEGTSFVGELVTALKYQD